MERIEETGLGSLRLIQTDDTFRYGIDAVLLADYAAAKAGRPASRIAELGSGNGIVSFLMAEKMPRADVLGIEFQQPLVALARRSCELNVLQDRVHFLHCDVADLSTSHPDLQEQFDLVVSNPPYVARGSGLTADSSLRHKARQETTADLADFLRAASWLLAERGRLTMVHRPSRLADLICLCREVRLEPKNLRFVAPRENAAPNIVLLQCIKGGGPELKVETPLHVYQEGQRYTDEILRIYGRK